MPTVEPSASYEATLNLGTAGLVGTVGLRVIDNVGNTVEARSTADIIEDPANSGLYQATRTAPATPGAYSLVWDDGDVPPHYAIDDLLVSVEEIPELGPPGAPAGGPCSDWLTDDDVAACCDVETTDSSIFADAREEAQALLFELSGRRYPGICQRTVRPCRTSCCCGWQVLSRGHLVQWRDDSWWCEEAPCGCSPQSKVPLSGYPVRAIAEVKIDGVVVNADTYALRRKRELVRMRDPADPDTVLTWPGCQNMDLADTEVGTFSITYLFGQAPPVDGVAAAAELACEIYKQCAGQECALPQGVTRVTRQGITIEKPAFAAWSRSPAGWSTGMSKVDGFLNARNRAGLQRRPTVYAPSITRHYAA